MYKVKSATSETPSYVASHISDSSTSTTWKTQGIHADASVVLEFPEPVKINQVLIINAGSAFCEILVRNKGTDWQHTKDFAKKYATRHWSFLKLFCKQFGSPKRPHGLCYVEINGAAKESKTNDTPLSEMKIEVPDIDDLDDSSEDTVDVPKSYYNQSSKAVMDTSEVKTQILKKTASPPKKPSVAKKPKPKAGESSSMSNQFLQPIKLKKKVPKKANATSNFGKKPLAGMKITLSGLIGEERTTLRKGLLALGAEYSQDYDPTVTHVVAAYAKTPKVKNAKAGGSYALTKDWLHQCIKTKSKVLYENFVIWDPTPQTTISPVKSKLTKKEKKELGVIDDDESGPDEYDYGDGFVVKDSDPMEEDKADFSYNNSKKRKFDDDLQIEEEEDYLDVTPKPKKPKVVENNEDTEELEENVIKRHLEELRLDLAKTKSKTQVEKQPKLAKKTKADDGASESEGTEEMDLTKVSKPKPETDDDDSDGTDVIDPMEIQNLIKQQTQMQQESDGDKSEDTEEVPLNASNPDMMDLDDLLPTFLQGLKVFFHGTFEQSEMKEMKRYILAYGGEVLPHLSDDTNITVTDLEWNSDFTEALAHNKQLQILTKEWVYECHKQQKNVGYGKFRVKKT